MGTTLYPNQFGMSVNVGMIDLDIMRTGRIAGMLSPNQGSAVVAGSPAKIDTAIAYTQGTVINFLQAGENDLAFGFFAPTVQFTTFPNGVNTMVNVAGFFGPVMWMMANATITPGAVVYSDSTGAFVTVTSASSKARGIALDYAVNGQALRVMITNPLAIAS